MTFWLQWTEGRKDLDTVHDSRKNAKPFNLELDYATLPLRYSTNSRAKIRGKELLTLQRVTWFILKFWEVSKSEIGCQLVDKL